jgi:hypothetical protein
MPAGVSPPSPLTILAQALAGAPSLAGFLQSTQVFLGSRYLSKSNSSPPRIVIFPSEGKLRDPYHLAEAVRDVDRDLVAHLWGKDFDQLHDLQTRFMNALEYQASPQPSSPTPTKPAGVYWKAIEEKWDTTPDSAKQGEEVFLVLTVPIAFDRTPLATGLVESVSIVPGSTSLTAAMGFADTVAQVLTTAGFAPHGIAQIESEQVSYAGLTSTSLTGLVRGVNGTAGSGHSSGTAVTPVAHT